MKLQGKHSLMLAALAAIAMASTAQGEDVKVKQKDGSDWTIKITPGPVTSPAPAEGKAAEYTSTYDSIPFSRSMYESNPNYQHDATMEMLFDQLRPGTNVNVGGNVSNMLGPMYSPWGIRRVSPCLGTMYSPWGAYRSPYLGFGRGYYPGFVGSATIIQQVP